ncbi:unnamed protein product [Arctia plantaginis]|uniref:Uncharacterized protein n=1 Tax=Arctia plantaginis TaxID=874455 RepID=A0A8S1B338_ARCPL|nr:unnamed protein product [Arctia plantaginis]
MHITGQPYKVRNMTQYQRVQRRGADGRGRRALRRAARGVGDGVCACARDKCGAPLAPTRSRFTLRGSNVNATLYVPPEKTAVHCSPAAVAAMQSTPVRCQLRVVPIASASGRCLTIPPAQLFVLGPSLASCTQKGAVNELIASMTSAGTGTLDDVVRH